MQPGPGPMTSKGREESEQALELFRRCAVLLGALLEHVGARREDLLALRDEVVVVVRRVLFGLDELLDGGRPSGGRLRVERTEVRAAVEGVDRLEAYFTCECEEGDQAIVAYQWDFGNGNYAFGEESTRCREYPYAGHPGNEANSRKIQ